MSQSDIEESRGDLTLTSDPARMDVSAIHRYLSQESYWARGIPLDLVARSLANSLCFGIFDGPAQVAFARVVSDRATFAWLCDVFVLEPYRRRGLARWLLDAIDRHPDVQGLRRWALATRDAHPLYARVGYAPIAHPDRHMERTVVDAYTGGRTR